MRSHRFLAASVAAAFALVPGLAPPAALAQDPRGGQSEQPCASVVGSAPPAPTAEQADYRRRLHRLATGAGVKIAVIDTGVNPHPQLPRLDNGPDLVADSTSLDDCDLHGTAVAGVIASRDAGIAPGVSIVSIRQSSGIVRRPNDRSDAEGAGDLATLARAIDEAITAGAQVINASVVSCLPPAAAEGLDTRPLDAALDKAERAGVVVVAAAGNTGGGCSPGDVVFPSHSSTVLAVAALDTPHDTAGYSLPAALSAPGAVPVALGRDAINARWASAKRASNSLDAQPFHGTSFAAPHVAAVAALLRERHPNATAAQLRAHIRALAEPGTGFVDPLLTVSSPLATSAAFNNIGHSASAAALADAAPTSASSTRAARLPAAPVRLGLLLGGCAVIALVGVAARATVTASGPRR